MLAGQLHRKLLTCTVVYWPEIDSQKSARSLVLNGQISGLDTFVHFYSSKPTKLPTENNTQGDRPEHLLQHIDKTSHPETHHHSSDSTETLQDTEILDITLDTNLSRPFLDSLTPFLRCPQCIYLFLVERTLFSPWCEVTIMRCLDQDPWDLRDR